jgi:hypothetical protein
MWLPRFVDWPETGFEAISPKLNDHTDRGVGGRQYGTSEDIETLQGKNNASTSRLLGSVVCESPGNHCFWVMGTSRAHRQIWRCLPLIWIVANL